MPKITLTDFIDVIQKAGAPKMTKVSQIKNRGEYGPAKDLYKIFRDGVVDTHEKGGTKADIKGITAKTTEPSRKKHYPQMVDGYVKWWGKKELAWFDPQSVKYESAGVEVSVNPELGLSIDGTKHLIKMYLKAEPLTKARAELILALMEQSLRKKTSAPTAMSVLDVRTSKLHSYTPSSKPMKPLLDAELAYIASLWPHV